MSKKFRTFRGFEIIRSENDQLSASLEDYLEMIYRKTKSEKFMRMTDLADELNVSASAITKNVQRLACLGFVNYEPYGKVELTEMGKHTGEFLYNRHITIERFFQTLGCKDKGFVETEMIEHYLSRSTVSKLEKLTKFLIVYQDIWQEYLTNHK
ncbi:MAG: metal-dependent transcriptional regulator [Bacillota bacterium]|nr:metal-dependent transcriptional regulator [Bacillota bacterium]MDD4264186.1 metal-dependent transcriptional regulator [Bacillota bacterium]